VKELKKAFGLIAWPVVNFIILTALLTGLCIKDGPRAGFLSWCVSIDLYQQSCKGLFCFINLDRKA